MTSVTLKKKHHSLKLKKLDFYRKFLLCKFNNNKNKFIFLHKNKKMTLQLQFVEVKVLCIRLYRKYTLLNGLKLFLKINAYARDSRKIFSLEKIFKNENILKFFEIIKSLKSFLKRKKKKIISENSQQILNLFKNNKKQLVVTIYNNRLKKSIKYFSKINHLTNLSFKLFLIVSKIKKNYIKIRGKLLNNISH